MNMIKRFWNWLLGRKEDLSDVQTITEDLSDVQTITFDSNIPRYGRKVARGKSRRLHRRAAREYLNGNPIPMEKLSIHLQGRSFLNCGKNLLSRVTRKARSASQ